MTVHVGRVGPALDVDGPTVLADLLAGRGPGPTPGGVAAARRRIEVAVAGAGRVPPLQVDRRQLQAGRRLPTAGDGGPPGDGDDRGPFRPSPARCRRAIGLDAVDGCLRGRWTSAAEAVAAVLAEAAGRLATGPSAPWWAGWWSTLGPGGRAVVRAEAVTWATRLWTGVDWGRLAGGDVVVVSRDERWSCPTARWLRLRGRVDMRVGVPGAGGAYLVVGGGPAPRRWSTSLALPVLVGALARGPAGPCPRVVGWWPDSGQVRVCDVDDEMLVATAAEVAGLAGSWWRAAAPPARIGDR